MPAGPSGDDPGRRLRDLGPHQRLIAAALAVLLLVPVAVSAGRAIADDWLPSGDEAVIAVRVHDVLTADPPLTGLPSTSDLYGTGIRTRHPGPIEFYLLALPVRLLGPQLGLLLGAGAIAGTSLLVCAWVALRRAGPAVALGVGVLLVATTWSTGTAVLTDPISSNVGGYPLLAATVLAWALLLGDLRLLPLAVGVVSFVAQQHLGVVIPALAVAAVGVVGVFLALRERWADRAARRSALAWVGGGVLVGAVLWLPVAIDQVTGDPGNITAILRFSGDEGRASLGHREATSAVLRSAAPPPLQLRRDVTGLDLTQPLGAVRTLLGAAVLVALAGLTVLAWRRHRPLAALGPVGLVLAAAGFLATTSVPDSFESRRINLYRWSWALALVVWWAAGWGVARVAAARADRVPGPVRALRPAGPVLALGVAGAVVVASLATSGPDDARRDAGAFDVDRRLRAVAVDEVADDGPVMVVADGSAAGLSVAPAIIARLVEEGVDVQVPAERTDAYGDHRAFDPATAGSVLVVASAFGPLAPIPGTALAEVELTPATAAVVERLVTAARSAPVVRSDRAPELRAGLDPGVATLTDHAIDTMAAGPSEALRSPHVLDLLLAGYLDSPVFGRADLEAMREALPRQRTLWADDRVALRRLTVEELRTWRPALFRSR
jgi:hypothetical protein